MTTETESTTEAETPSLELAKINPAPISIHGGEDDPIFYFNGDEMIIRQNLSWDEYLQGLAHFKRLKTKGKEYFSQYVTFGRLKFPQKQVDAALGQLEFELSDVKSALSIASVPPELHRPGFTAEHYEALGRGCKNRKEMKKWADVASAQSLSPSQLKASIEAGEVVDPHTARKQQHGIVSIHGIRMDFDIWYRRVDGIKGIRKMEAAALSEILKDLKPMVLLYNELTKPSDKKARKPAKKAAKKPAKGKK